MKRPLLIGPLFSFLLPCAGTGRALAASPPADAALPEVHSTGTVSYVSGGVGDDEASAMKSAARHYSVSMMFVTRETDGRGAYTSGTVVRVRNGAGETVLDTAADGPFLLVNLPPGKYQIEASDGRRVQRRSLAVTRASHATLSFLW